MRRRGDAGVRALPEVPRAPAAARDHWMHHLDYELTHAEWGDTTRTQRFQRPMAPR